MTVQDLLNEVDGNGMLTLTEKKGLKVMMRFYFDTKENKFFSKLEKDYFQIDILLKLGYITKHPNSDRKYIWKMDKPNIQMLREIHEAYQIHIGKELLDGPYFYLNSDSEKKQLSKVKQSFGFNPLKIVTNKVSGKQLQLPLNKKVTLADVGNKLNLDPSTISKALNDKGKIKEKTKTLIRKTALEMGYNSIGSTHVKKDSKIGMGVKPVSDLTKVSNDVADEIVSEINKSSDTTPKQNISLFESFISIVEKLNTDEYKTLIKEIVYDDVYSEHKRFAKKYNITTDESYDLAERLKAMSFIKGIFV